MSKTITIPSDRGSRIIVDINGVEYVYAAGATVTVPDEVAACIADAVAMKPGGHRESAFEEEMANIMGGIGEAAAAITSLDSRVDALEENQLPAYESTDEGKILTLVENTDNEVVPAWAAAADDGGGGSGSDT